MLALLFAALVSVTMAVPYMDKMYSGVGVLGPAYSAPIPVAAVAPVAAVVEPKSDISYTVTNVNSHTGAIKQQTAVGKDALGGHTIRHSAQAHNVDPHSGQTDVKHDEHEFHINPYYGEAAVHTNNAEGSLNPAIGHAAFMQKSHEAKIAPGHTSVADVKETAAVSPHSNAASRDVKAARADVLHDGIAHNAHASHKSYANVAGLGGEAHASETNKRSFEGHGYGNLHYDTQSANQAYDVHGRASANEAGYKLDQAYDARVNLGASNEVEYSRHAAHDALGNYGAVTQTRQASQGGQLVPEVPVVATVVEEPAVVYNHPVAYKQPAVYQEETSVVYKPQPVVYKQPAVVYGSHGYVPSAPIGYGGHDGYYHGY